MAVTCQYCEGAAELVTGREVYPHRPELAAKRFWRCDPCGAYVGCHPGTERALGELADARTRTARRDAHEAFDILWRHGAMRRGEAYAWLAKKLGIDQRECHIGSFDAATCAQVVNHVRNYRLRTEVLERDRHE